MKHAHRSAILLGLMLFSAMGCGSMSGKLASLRNRSTGDPPRSRFAMARLAEREGNLQHAQGFYEDILSADPNHVGAHQRLAIIATHQNHFDEAESHFQAALKANPKDASVMGDLGYAYYLQDRLDEAESTLRMALEHDPNSVPIRTNLALVLGQKGQFATAFDLFRETASEAEAHANLAYIHAQRGELEQAQHHFNQALTLDPKLRIAAEGMIQIARRLKSNQVAEQQLAAQQSNVPLNTQMNAAVTNGDLVNGLATNGHVAISAGVNGATQIPHPGIGSVNPVQPAVGYATPTMRGGFSELPDQRTPASDSVQTAAYYQTLGPAGEKPVPATSESRPISPWGAVKATRPSSNPRPSTCTQCSHIPGKPARFTPVECTETDCLLPQGAPVLSAPTQSTPAPCCSGSCSHGR